MSAKSLIRRPFKYSYFSATIYIIAINVVAWLVSLRFPIIKAYMAMSPLAVHSGYVWQFFTYMFAHNDLSHLLVNMLGLFMFGTSVERSMGSKEFLCYYLFTGVMAGITSYAIFALTGAWNTFLLGASGALFGVLLAFAVINPDARVLLWGIIPLRANVMVIGYTAVEIFSQLFSYQQSVAHFTHLAGFAWAWVYFLARFGINPAKRLVHRR
ncbi:MAG: rhomboid family intramembrane serine protease [Spirochaetaceae bacterium]|nr:rhomboid family intramembrane serine protease [Spirochaetaceae bacterium]